MSAIYRVIIAAVWLLPMQLTAQQITVAPDGAVRTLQAGIDMAVPHDTLLVKKGHYREHDVKVDKPLTILGEQDAIIDGEGKSFVLIITADDVTVSGIEVRHTSRSFMDDYAGILVEETNNTVIKDVVLKETFFGIYLAETANTLLENNHITATGGRETTSGNGIHLWNSRDTRIINNYIQGHRDGIYIEFVEGATIRDNMSERNLRYGIHFMYADNCRYEGNTFRDNGGGVAVMYTDNVDIINNRFEDNWGSSAYGMLLKEINRSRIEGNHFQNNSVGLYIESTNKNSFKNNTFVQNGWAVKLMANATDNLFSYNNFIANSFEILTNSRQSFNEFEHNYWSQYEGYDLDRDGIGDVPHRPVRLFSVIVEKQPQALLLLRSLLIDILDAAERLMPVLTPETLIDTQPQMSKIS